MSNPLLAPERFRSAAGQASAPPPAWPDGRPAGAPGAGAPFPPPHPGAGGGTWPPPHPGGPGGGGSFPPPHPGGSFPPPAPQPGSSWAFQRAGVASKTGLLLGLVVAFAAVGWALVPTTQAIVVDDGQVVERTVASFPGWIIPAFLVALGLAVASVFRPLWARFLAPAYAVVKGTVVGAISHVYESRYDGIVLQAFGLTIAVFLAMLVIYATGLIRVTPRFRQVVVLCTVAIGAVYLLTLVAHVFGGSIPFIHDSGIIGIAFSLFAVTIASLNLTLDFDFVDKAEQAGAPKAIEWYAALGLIVTLVWLYLELLRLLAKLQRR